jgi:hypothetical protein
VLVAHSDHNLAEREQKRRRPPFPIRATVGAAARAARRDAGPILAVALAVSLVSTGLEIGIEHAVDPASGAVAAVAELGATAVTLAGTVFLAGFVCRLIGAAEHGRERLGLGQVARTLPWWRLIGADLVVVVIVVVGLLALVIPGLILFNVLAVTGPVIEIEERSVRGALRRSAALVWPYFWPVALLATLPVAAASELESLAPEPSGPAQIVTVLLVQGVTEALIESVIAVVLVQVCYRLIALARLPGARRPGTRRSGARAQRS